MGYGFRLRFVGYVWGFEASIRAECFGASIVRCMIGRSIFRLGFFGCRLGMIRSRFLVLILDYLEVYWFCIRVYFFVSPRFLTWGAARSSGGTAGPSYRAWMGLGF